MAPMRAYSRVGLIFLKAATAHGLIPVGLNQRKKLNQAFMVLVQCGTELCSRVLNA